MTTTYVSQEAIADVPLLMYILREKLGYDKFLDQIRERHGNWQGLSLGQVMVTWLAHILSEHNHFMSHVQDWANQHAQILAQLLH